MVHYQHYSFDLWLTLIKSNPWFKIERAKYFHQHFNWNRKPLEDVQLAFRQVDLMCNAINEKTGKNIDAEEMYLMVITLINDHKISLHQIDTDTLYKEMDNLVFNYLPEIYSDDTANVLYRLKSTTPCSLNILSNTGFIKGKTLRRILDALALSSYFDFQLYSDELGLSKPNKHLFTHLLDRVRQLKQGEVDVKTIIHIGDNPLADVEGANAVGMSSLLINSNQLSILSLLN